MISKETLKKMVQSQNFLSVKEVSHLERIDALSTLLKFSRAQFKDNTGLMYTVVLGGDIITVYQGNDLWSYTLEGTPVQGNAALENLLELGI